MTMLSLRIRPALACSQGEVVLDQLSRDRRAEEAQFPFTIAICGHGANYAVQSFVSR